MSYHAVGKYVWDELPSLFQNPALAETLEEDTIWWVYTYMFPSESQPGKTCAFDCLIQFRKSDNSFKKVLQPYEVK